MSSLLLSILIAIPLLAGAVVMFMPRQKPGAVRSFAIAAMLVELVVSFGVLILGDYTTADMQLVQKLPLVPMYGISYEVGIDGISLWLVLLTTFVTPIATYASWTSIDTKIKEFAIAFLWLEAFMIGALVSLDLFLFYVFWELMLVPMLLIIGVWGGPQRVYAAVKFFIYTMVGSLLMLVAILYLVAQYKAETGNYSFSVAELQTLLLPVSTQIWLFSAFALAFAIKVPM